MNERKPSLIIEIQKTRVFCKISPRNKYKSCKKRISDKTIRKPSEGSLRKYSLPGTAPLHRQGLTTNELLLAYRMFAKKEESFKHKQRLGIKLNKKYKIMNTDLRKRLHVGDPEDDVRTVTDVDESFYHHLDGYSLRSLPLYKSLKYIFQQQLRIKQEIGYRRDIILNIDSNHRNELKVYKNSIDKYTQQVKQFEAFISEDYEKSMACLKNCDDLKSNVTIKSFELEALANKMFRTQSRLIGLDYLYFMQQKYGRFLYYLSPPSWRAKNKDFACSVEIEAKGFDLGTSNEEDTFIVIFEKMQKECYSGLVKPALYFNHPDDLIDIFDAIQTQQLHNFCQVSHLTPRTKMLKLRKKELKNKIEADSVLVKHIIDHFKKLLNFFEERESQLQDKFMKILNGVFFNCVGATDVIKLKLHLEFCYEKIYAEKLSSSTGMSIHSLAKALESTYMQYSKDLENLHEDKIQSAVKKCRVLEDTKFKNAEKAARELHFYKRLENSLLRAFKPAVQYTPVAPGAVRVRGARRTSQSAHNAKRHYSNVVKTSSTQRELTEGELEYLTLFTDWQEPEDPARYIQCLNETPIDNSYNSG